MQRDSTQGRPCEDGRDTAPGQGCLELPGALQGRQDPPLKLLGRVRPCPHLDLGLLASRTARE